MKKALLWVVGVLFVAAALYFWFVQEWPGFHRPPWDGAFYLLGASAAAVITTGYVIGEIWSYFQRPSPENRRPARIEVIHRPIYEEIGERPKLDTLAVEDEGRTQQVAVVAKRGNSEKP